MRLPRWFATTLLISPALAHAVIGGAGLDANLASSPWAGVGAVTTSAGSYSGTLIAPGYVLTAAHVVAGADVSNVSFSIYAGVTTTISASQIYVFPGYTGFKPEPGKAVHNDLAIIRLSADAPAAVPHYDLHLDPLRPGIDIVTFVGYGGSCCAKRSGENRIDSLIPNATTNTPEVFLFDYDGPDLTTNRMGADIPRNGTLGANREATLQGGDSGSPAFILDGNGQWKLAGVNTFIAAFDSNPLVAGAFGTGGGGQVVSAYSDWINSVLASGSPVSPVPEPDRWSMALLGLVLVAGAALRKSGMQPEGNE